MASNIQEEVRRAAQIIGDAGGSVVGRTRLQKIVYILEVMELENEFDFEYKHYGPYSERLSTALKYGDMLGIIHEDVKTAAWGGHYSIFTSDLPASSPAESPRAKALCIGNEADPVELELAATAILLFSCGFDDPWGETEQRKPEKSGHGRLEKAKSLVVSFKELDEHNKIPNIV